MKFNRKSIVTVTAGLVAGGAIGFAAGVPGLTSAADAPMVGSVDSEYQGVARSERLRIERRDAPRAHRDGVRRRDARRVESEVQPEPARGCVGG